MLSSKKENSPVMRLCTNAVLVALMFVFDIISIKVGNLKVTFGGIPIILSAILYGPVNAAAVGLLGSLLGQLFTYGLGPTTVLWILPAGVRGIVMGLLFIAFGKSCKFEHLVTEIIISSFAVTFANTVVMYLDGLIMKYPVQIVLYEIGVRLLISVITCVVYAVIIKCLTEVISKYLNKSNKA